MEDLVHLWKLLKPYAKVAQKLFVGIHPINLMLSHLVLTGIIISLKFVHQIIVYTFSLFRHTLFFR
jgi:hypothetical protein